MDGGWGREREREGERKSERWRKREREREEIVHFYLLQFSDFKSTHKKLPYLIHFNSSHALIVLGLVTQTELRTKISEKRQKISK